MTDTKNVYYEVWALGFDKESMCTDVEEFLGEFDEHDKAIEHAKKFKDISYVYSTEEMKYLEDGDYLHIIVETLRKGDKSYTNIETIYEQDIY